MDTIFNKAIEMAWAYGPKTLAAAGILFGGLWLIRSLTRGFDLFLQARKVDEGLRPFFTSMTEGPIESIPENSEVQVEITLLLQPQASIEKLQQAANEAAALCPHVLANKSVDVKVGGITRDDLKAHIGVWVLGQHYEDTLPQLYEAVKETLAAAGIELAKERRKDVV